MSGTDMSDSSFLPVPRTETPPGIWFAQTSGEMGPAAPASTLRPKRKQHLVSRHRRARIEGGPDEGPRTRSEAAGEMTMPRGARC